MEQYIRYASLAEEAHEYWRWTRKYPIPQPDNDIAKEGAGSEFRTPLMHFGTVMPVYLAVQRYLRAVPLKKGARLVELGCGTGRALSYLQSQFPELEVWGTDYSGSCISYAKNAYGKFGVKFVHASAQKTTLQSGSFDIVISSHVIEHISKEDGPAFIQETARLLKKGGFAFVGTPERRHCQNVYMKNPTDDPAHRLVPPHEHEYSLEELKSLASHVFHPSKVQVDKLMNPFFYSIFSSSIKRFKPQKDMLSKIKNLGYRTIRDVLPKSVFDSITSTGATITLKSQHLSYRDILMENSIVKEETESLADNLLLVCQK